MIYARIKVGVWVKYEDSAETGTILFRRKMVARKQDINARLAELPAYPDDTTLLAWAKANYPALNTSLEKQLLTDELSTLQTDLDQMVND